MDEGFWALFEETGAPEFYLLSREKDRAEEKPRA